MGDTSEEDLEQTLTHQTNSVAKQKVAIGAGVILLLLGTAGTAALMQGIPGNGGMKPGTPGNAVSLEAFVKEAENKYIVTRMLSDEVSEECKKAANKMVKAMLKRAV